MGSAFSGVLGIGGLFLAGFMSSTAAWTSGGHKSDGCDDAWNIQVWTAVACFILAIISAFMMAIPVAGMIMATLVGIYGLIISGVINSYSASIADKCKTGRRLEIGNAAINFFLAALAILVVIIIPL